MLLSYSFYLFYTVTFLRLHILADTVGLLILLRRKYSCIMYNFILYDRLFLLPLNITCTREFICLSVVHIVQSISIKQKWNPPDNTNTLCLNSFHHRHKHVFDKHTWLHDLFSASSRPASEVVETNSSLFHSQPCVWQTHFIAALFIQVEFGREPRTLHFGASLFLLIVKMLLLRAGLWEDVNVACTSGTACSSRDLYALAENLHFPLLEQHTF